MTKLPKIIRLLTVSILITLASSTQLKAQNSGYEHIESFDVEINILETGHILVTESIKYDFGTDSRHGIFRTIPYLKTNDKNERLILDFTDVSVTDEFNRKITFETSKTSDLLKIKIGDPDKLISGAHEYVIKYKVAGALTYFDDFDELYWNITGNEWDVPINKATARVFLPANIPDTLRPNTKASCYTGRTGSTQSFCNISITSEGRIGYLFFTEYPLNFGEGLTIVVNFPKGFASYLAPRLDKLYSIYQTFRLLIVSIVVITWGLLAPLITLWYWFKDWKNTKSKEKILSAWFSPPKNPDKTEYTPAESGILLNKSTGSSLITATIIQLAQKGFLKIVVHNKNDFDFIKLKDFNDPSLKNYEKSLLKGLFSDVKAMKLDLGKFTSKLGKIKGMMSDGKIDEKEQEEIAQMFGAVTDINVVNIKTLKNSTNFPNVVQLFNTQLGEHMMAKGLFRRNPETINSLFSVIGVVSLTLLNPIMSAISFAFGRKSAPRTDLGIEKYSEAKSLLNFLKSQSEQLDFQAQNQMFFEKLLPYATAFGVEKIWAEKFKDINFTKSDWYEGSTYNSMAFSSFSSSLNSSVRSYSSTSSSGSSGGSSGGGGGGGGGGSW
ncbi:DUF2207 domain-containing protein [candidate division WWE3 bacterium]|jgi:uncharacterized membrane protein YgcG|uniref:DUF2207 domain-containing protein n=1 Tax=candidate division WWE3 bacterium TaxID=2053526 RepID=A0A3A4ZI11_UNCKA|nr:MAG: DUF2207 domain-containing protein [candidate division WWE3 bacterium]